MYNLVISFHMKMINFKGQYTSTLPPNFKFFRPTHSYFQENII